MRLIDADRLNKEIKDRFGYSSATAFVRNMQDLSQVEVFKHIMKLIEVAPTLEKRQPGEWLEDSGVIACSHCHTIWLYRKTNYCPNCGAKMKGAEND
jgi:uncharacterized paraquat-inducible protein A